jgi:hypothetical protein
LERSFHVALGSGQIMYSRHLSKGLIDERRTPGYCRPS